MTEGDPGQGTSTEPAFQDDDTLYNLTLQFLVRERELGAARSDLAGMLLNAQSLLAVRDRLLLGSMSQRKKEGLLAIAEDSLSKYSMELPPLSSLVKAISSPKEASAACRRTSDCATVLLLTAAPQTTSINIKALSTEVRIEKNIIKV